MARGLEAVACRESCCLWAGALATHARGEEEHGVKGALARFFADLSDRYGKLLRRAVSVPAALVVFAVFWQ